jgi:hypothetical protein
LAEARFDARAGSALPEPVLCRGGRPRDLLELLRETRTARFCLGGFLEILAVVFFRFESKAYSIEAPVSRFPIFASLVRTGDD